MANTDKNIVITPNKGHASNAPEIRFTGADASTSASVDLHAYPTATGTLSFEKTDGTKIFAISGSGDASLAGRMTYGAYQSNIGTFAGATGTVTLNLALANTFYISPAGSITIALSNVDNTKATTISIHLVNGGSYTISWPASWAWTGGSAPSLGTGTTVDLIVAQQVDGTKFRAAKVQSHPS